MCACWRSRRCYCTNVDTYSSTTLRIVSEQFAVIPIGVLRCDKRCHIYEATGRISHTHIHGDR